MRWLALVVLASPAAAAPCGGDFAACLDGDRQDARALKADRAPGVFGMPLAEFARTLADRHAATCATRRKAAPEFDPGKPEAGLDREAMQRLQEKLQARGHDVGRIDAILGAAARRAVQAEQARPGLPADGWPTPRLLEAL